MPSIRQASPEESFRKDYSLPTEWEPTTVKFSPHNGSLRLSLEAKHELLFRTIEAVLLLVGLGFSSERLRTHRT